MHFFWSRFIDRIVRQAKNPYIGEVTPGLGAWWGNSALPFMNEYVLQATPREASEYRAYLEAALADAAPRGLPWIFVAPKQGVCAESFAALDAEAGAVGMQGFLTIAEMTADARRLLPPRRALPEMEFERIASRAAIETALRINLEAYAMPLEILASTVEAGMFFADARREIGLIGRVDGEAVSTAGVVELDGWLYVYLVATAPGQQRKGYAEAVVRKALALAAEEWGVTRTALDASEMGAPVYRAMGYEETGGGWRALGPAH